jgi:magnesium-transporting ATPase (P-type)
MKLISCASQVIKAKRHELDQMNQNMGMRDGYTNVGMVIEGGALALCLRSELQDEFMSLCKECRALVCCRVSPMQKAQVSTKARPIGVSISCGNLMLTGPRLVGL